MISQRPKSPTQTLPVAEKTYPFKELYIETIIRNPNKGRSFRLQVCYRTAYKLNEGVLGSLGLASTRQGPMDSDPTTVRKRPAVHVLARWELSKIRGYLIWGSL